MKTLLALIFIVSGSTLFAQDSLRDETLKNRFKFNGFPFVYYTPETSLAFGATALLTFNFKGDSIGARASNINPGLAYTINKQILLYIPFNLLLDNDNYRMIGALGAYKYTYFYYGIGNDIPENDSTEETYDVSYPRIRFSGYKKILKNTFLGIRYNFDYFTNLKYDSTGALFDREIIGTNGGVNSGLGIAAIFDSRDNIYYPRTGWFVDASTTFDRSYFGSDYDFDKTNLDIAYFLSPAKKSVLGINAYLQDNKGEVPFYHLGLLGGNKKMRGLFEGRFRDLKAIQTQVEWRQEFLKNFGWVLFAGAGWISNDYASLRIDDARFAYGGGLRYKLNKKEHINIRLDIGLSKYGVLPYLTIGESF